MRDRVILHCDCNGFFASVEYLLDPSLKDVPIAVAGDSENRHGIILAKNELEKNIIYRQRKLFGRQNENLLNL